MSSLGVNISASYVAESAEIIAELFNDVLTNDQKNLVRDECKKKIGKVMYVNGYSLVFGRWYKQHPSHLGEPSYRDSGEAQ